MSERRTTLRDVAAAAGVSAMTVSRVLHGKPGVGPALHARIAALAERMGYVPHRTAYPLGRPGGTMTVGVVIPQLANTIFPDMLQAVEAVLSASGYRILLCCTYDNPIKEFHDIAALLERQVDGLVWAPVLMTESLRAAERVRGQGCPLVFLDRIIPGFPTDAVRVDDGEGASTLTRHLLQRRYRKIAYLGPRLESHVARERREGVRRALEDAGVPPRPEWTVAIGADIDAGRAGIERLLSLPTPPEAVVCFNDPLAVGAQMAMLARGLDIPGDMALTGFSDAVEASIARVPITSMRQDGPALGRAAAELLLSRLVNPSIRPVPVERVLPTHLVVRASTRAAPRASTRPSRAPSRRTSSDGFPPTQRPTPREQNG